MICHKKKHSLTKQYIICFCLIDVFELIIHLDCLGAVKHDDFFEQLRKQLETHRLEPSVSCLEDHPSKDTWLGSPISAINFGHLKKGSHNPN